MWSLYISIERQKFISGTSDGRGSPEYSESNTSSQRRSTALWKGKGPAVDSTSPPKPLKATRTTSGLRFRNFVSASRKASTLPDWISSGVLDFSVAGVAARKSTKSNLNIRMPWSYQYCSVSMKCGRKPPSKKDISPLFAVSDVCHSGMGLIFTSSFVPNQSPGWMPLSRHFLIHASGPFGQFGLRQVRYPPSDANQKASIM